MPDVVNIALGLAQYITNCMNEEQAVSYLLAVESLTLQDWKGAKLLLPGADLTNRQTREGTVKDIVNCFINENIEDDYLVKDLSILPGLSRPALELISYNLATLYAIRLSHEPSRSTNQAYPLSDSRRQQQIAAEDYPALTLDQSSQSADNNLPNSYAPPAPPADWSTVKKLPYKRNKRVVNQPLKNQPRVKKTLVQGTSGSQNTEIKHPLKFVCLAVRSGSNETVESLEAELCKWNCLTDLKIEHVRESYHSSMFRVQFNVPTSLCNKWKDPTAWPARMTVSEWRGNPKQPLKAPKDRLYTKRIYLGNLSADLTQEQLTKNMKHIYKEDIEKKRTQKIETHWNEKGISRALQKQIQDPSREAPKSACIVITSYPGQTLVDVSLKLEHYSPKIRRSVRHWNGPIPRPTEPAKSNLNW